MNILGWPKSSFRFFHRMLQLLLLFSRQVMSDSVTPWTAAGQAPLSMGSSRQEYWSGLPFPTPGDLPDPGTEPTSLKSLALTGGSFTTEPPGKPDVRKKETFDQSNILKNEGEILFK